MRRFGFPAQGRLESMIPYVFAVATLPRGEGVRGVVTGGVAKGVKR